MPNMGEALVQILSTTKKPLKHVKWCYFYSWDSFLELSIGHLVYSTYFLCLMRQQVLFFFFSETGTQYIWGSTGWPGTHNADQTSLKLTDLPASTSFFLSLSPKIQVIFEKKSFPWFYKTQPSSKGVKHLTFKTKRKHASWSMLCTS